MVESNFSFLEGEFPSLANLGALAEGYQDSDPNSSLTKLGMLGEQMVAMIFKFDRLREPRAECAKSGTTVESIDFDKLKGLPLSLPTIEEQEEIVRVIGESMTELERSGKLCRQSLEKLIGVRESLVAAAFRGKIDTAATDNYVVTNYQSAY